MKNIILPNVLQYYTISKGLSIEFIKYIPGINLSVFIKCHSTEESKIEYDMSIRQVINKRIPSKRVIAALLLIAIVCYLVFLPNFIKASLWKNTYRDWLDIKPEPYSGIITVWHIVSFRPYIGSIGTWLNSRATEFAKEYIGVFFEVESYTVEEALEQLSRGRQPDMISFAHGTQGADGLMVLENQFDICVASGVYGGSLLAVPYCASAHLLIFDPNETAGMSSEQLAENAGTIEDYKKGNANACIADAKAAGDLYRAEIAGKGRFFEALPYPSDTQLVQYIAASGSLPEQKKPYVIGFIQHIVGTDAQNALADIGLIPMNTAAAGAYGLEWLSAMASAFDRTSITNTFERYYFANTQPNNLG